MSRNLRDTGQRSMGDFVSRAPSGNRVEIIDDEDDEIEEINTQGGFIEPAGTSSRLSRSRTRRQRREDEQEQLFPGDEQNEDLQLQQVLMMSKLEADKQEERRKMCGSMQDVRNLQVEIEPLNSFSRSTATARKPTGNERDRREGAESPDLFSTPPEDEEQLSNITASKNVDSDTEFPDSPPLPVTVRSPEVDPNDESGKATSSQQAASPGTSLRQEKGDTRRKLKLRRTRRPESDLTNQKEKNLEDEPERTECDIQEQETPSANSKIEERVTASGEKRKLSPDIDDFTDDEEPIQVLRKRVSLKRKKASEFFDSVDWDDLQDVDNKGTKRPPDGVNDPLPKRIAVVSDTDEKTNEKELSTESRQLRTPTNCAIRLFRKYKKPRCSPTTLKEAMEANLYFAPPGFDLPSYTQLIIRMFEKYRRQLYVAQSKVKTRIPWGPPVVTGNVQGTLDALLPGKTTASIGMRSSAFIRGALRGATSTDVNNQSEQSMFDRRRTLRSSSKQATVSTSTSKTTSASTTTTPFKVDSDSDDDDCMMKSYLDEIARPSASTSTKKPATGWSKPRASSNREFGEARESRKAESPGEASVKIQTSSKDRVCDKKSYGKAETREPAMNDQDVSFGANVVLDSNSSEIQSNTVDSSAQKLQNDSKGTNNYSRMSQTKLDSETSMSKGGVLPESKTTEDEVCVMDIEQENQAEVIRPPKRRSILRPFDDDSTDDERYMSSPMFSLRFPGEESSVDCEMPSPRRENDAEIRTFVDSGEDGGGEDVNNDHDPLTSQSLTPQSESQRIVGKSVLETMATEGDEPLPSQALSSESGEAFNKPVEETIEECNVTRTASSSMNQGEERFVEEEKIAVDVDEDASQRARRLRSERAAAAAERRHKQTTGRRDVREACSSSACDDFSMIQPQIENAEAEQQQESTVECPLCYQHFTSKEIEAHASDCQGPPPSPQAPSYSAQTWEETGARSEPGPSFRSVPARGTNQSSAVYRTLTGERGELKKLKVVLQRSPIAKQKLLQKVTQETDSAKRNLDFEKNSTRSGSLDRYCSSRSFDQGSRKPSRNTRAALRTESETDGSGYEKEKGESSWLDAAGSPKKKKPKWTYGGSSFKGKAPILGGDYIPLIMSEKSDTDDGTTGVATKEQERKQTSCRTEEVVSNSDTSDDSNTSDDELMVKYGAQRVSSRNKQPKGKKKENETDENEIALALLGNRTKKRPLSLSKGSKAKKCCRPRSSDSDEDSDELYTVCKLCNEKVLKEMYEQHVNEELEERKRTGGAPRKEEVVTTKDTRQRSNKDGLRRLNTREKEQKNIPSQSAATEDNDSDEQEHDIDWDGVSNSPIKCFQFTGNANSVVDFQNQFEHLKQAKRGKRGSNYEQNYSSRGNRGGDRGYGSRGGYRGSGNRGNYRGSYKKVYARGKKYRKHRGSRGGK